MNLPDDITPESAAEIVTTAMLASRSGRYVVIISDPQVGDGPTAAFGPFEEIEAVTRSEELRVTFSNDPETADVRVVLVPWEDS